MRHRAIRWRILPQGGWSDLGPRGRPLAFRRRPPSGALEADDPAMAVARPEA
ncbi:hypothetical protein [Thermoflexus sp.]|uniref:hypothetical protein n=1 Tax=Thermoflexus sp. TaxID=1969742 RepID=UPI002ADDADE8|nr:hypothetical protein [Thermoflexus sp.]